MAPKGSKEAKTKDQKSQTPTHHSKKLQTVLCYLVVCEIHASITVYSTEGKQTAAFDAYKQIIPSFFKQIKFPFKDDDFKAAFDVRLFTEEQLLRSTANKLLVPSSVWDKGMAARKELCKYIAEHSPLIKSAFTLRTSPSATAENEDEDDDSASQDDSKHQPPKDVTIDIPSGTTLDEVLERVRLEIYRAEVITSAASKKAAGSVVDVDAVVEHEGDIALQPL